jgi:Tfp pilus assembly protein PilO
MLPLNKTFGNPLSQLPKRIYVVSAMLLCAVLGTYFLAIKPQREALAAEHQRMQDQALMMDVLAAEMARLSGAKRQMEQLETAVGAFDERLPKKGEMDVILREVWLIADIAGLKTQRIRTLDEQTLHHVRVQPVEISLRGRFEGLYGFLLALERLPGLMKLQGISVRNVNERVDGELEASMILNVFCRQ